MLHFSDIQKKPVADQLLVFSDAYLDSAAALCKMMCGAKNEANYAHGAVVMSLTFHALELFLKAAIVRKVPDESFGKGLGHDLDHLYKRYSELYPGKPMEFDLPFRQEPLDVSALASQFGEDFLTEVKKQSKSMPQDQLHRYPINLRGDEWRAALGFEPYSFSLVLQKLRDELGTIRKNMPFANPALRPTAFGGA
ncbi:hypothetical protein AAFF27_09755 [Xylophilus sp. GW821-FHT01B05]